MKEVSDKVSGQVAVRSDLDRVFEQAILHLIGKIEQS